MLRDCPVGGARMVIRDGENGLLVPVGNSIQFAHAMSKILKDKELAEKLSNNAYKIREELPLNRIAQEWLRLM